MTSAVRRPSGWVVGGLAVAAAVGLGFWWMRSFKTGDEPGSPPPRATPAPDGPKAGLEVLRGKWLRQDGGYVLEIRALLDGGKLEAAYFNPRSIRVAAAPASRQGETLKVFVELRDANHPGSTYDLTYDAKRSSLRGINFQAAEQQRFDVEFVRSP